MNATTEVDFSKFRAAMQDYMVYTKKTAYEVINAKHRDCLYLAARATPKANRADILNVIESPSFISWYLNRIHGAGNWDYSDWNEISPGAGHDGHGRGGGIRKKLGLRRRLSAIGFMRSVFVRAAATIPRKDAHSTVAPVSVTDRRHNIRIDTQVTGEGTERVVSAVRMVAGARNASDASEKQSLLYGWLQGGINATTMDMKAYIRKKQVAKAKQISAR